MSYRKLGRTSGHRAALFRNQLASVIQHERITTTLPKAKELRPILEKLVTMSREDSVHNRRQAARQLQDDALVQKLFTQVAPRFTDRPGGYTRIIKLGPRRGDGAEMAILEFVDYELGKTSAAEPAKPSKPARKAKPAAEEGEGGEEAADEKPKKKPAAKKAAPKREASAKPAASKKAAPKKGATRGAKKGS